MPVNKPIKIAISGSLAYDTIMDFPGRFSDYIIPGQVNNLNVSFPLRQQHTSFGGTAGNIAYNLSLLGEKPTILGVVGSDFAPYRSWLLKNRIDISRLASVPSGLTAHAQIITDQDDNQIAAFCPGPAKPGYVDRSSRLSGFSLAIISPDDIGRMFAYAKSYKKQGIPYIFDPGQMVPTFPAAKLRLAIRGAQLLIGNDYEIRQVRTKLKITNKMLCEMVPTVVVTKGRQGSEIFHQGHRITIPPVKPKNTSDPTGAGDAYRAGLIKGLVRGYNLKTCGQLASLVAVYTVEKYGTQTHRFTLPELVRRYKKSFQEKLVIS